VLKSLLVTGGSGFIGGHVLAAALAAGWRVINADRTEVAPVPGIAFHAVDIADEGAVAALVADRRPDAIIHCAAIGDVDASERDPDRAWRVNVDGTGNIARAAAGGAPPAGAGARLILLSTSTVFDGRAGRYTEDDPPNPINIYGRTKVAAEHAVRVLHPAPLIARISMAYGYPRTGGASFLTRVAERLRAGEPTDQPADEFRTPIDVLTCADALIELADSDVSGVLHLGPRQRISRYDFALMVARRLRADPALVRDTRAQALPGRAPRPKDVSFNTDRAHALLRTPLLEPEDGLARALAAG
jgi:dTDP-4-dehydrorhamnose reductase